MLCPGQEDFGYIPVEAAYSDARSWPRPGWAPTRPSSTVGRGCWSGATIRPSGPPPLARPRPGAGARPTCATAQPRFGADQFTAGLARWLSPLADPSYLFRRRFPAGHGMNPPGMNPPGMNHSGMKVGITAYRRDPSRGTEFGLGWGWAKAYALRGHDVTVLTSRDAASREGRAMASLRGDLPPGLRFVELAPEVLDSISSPDGLPAMMSFHRSNQAWIDEAAAYLSDHTFDVVHHVSGGSVQGGSPLRDVKAGAVVFGPVGGGQRAPGGLSPFSGARAAARSSGRSCGRRPSAVGGSCLGRSRTSISPSPPTATPPP